MNHVETAILHKGDTKADAYATNRLQLLLEVAFDTTSEMRQWPNKQSIKYNPYDSCPFMGEELIKHGIHTIVMSWSSTDDWNGQSDFLYYNPTALSAPDRLQPIQCPTPEPLAKYLKRVGQPVERDWVAVKDVAWTLDTKVCSLDTRYEGM
jgi:hypothetical protein